MPVTVTCKQCGAIRSVIPARAKTFHCCSRACLAKWRSENRSGQNSPVWMAESREKTCQQCGKLYSKRRNRGVVHFRKQKFCSRPCADQGGLRYFGSENGNWNGNPRRKQRRGQHASWAKKVFSRDKATCQVCGINGVEMHAHHIKSFREHPESRFDVANGLTVCFKCHWDIHTIHTGSVANGVNSGKAAAGHAGGNPEPSIERNLVEGVTIRGRPYRRWEGNCASCGVFLSKAWCDFVTRRAPPCCSYACARRYYWREVWPKRPRE